MPQTDIPTSRWMGRCHSLEPQVSRNVHEYFLKYWPWRSGARAFSAARSRHLALLQLPDSLDDRIEPGVFLCTILFLIDGMHLFYLFFKKKESRLINPTRRA